MDLFAFMDLGAPELIIILVIILLLFGSKKLPQLSRSVGQSMKELRRGLNENENETQNQNQNQNQRAASNRSNYL